MSANEYQNKVIATARLIYKPDFYQIFTKGSLVHVELHKVIKLIKYNKIYKIFRKY